MTEAVLSSGSSAVAACPDVHIRGGGWLFLIGGTNRVLTSSAETASPAGASGSGGA